MNYSDLDEARRFLTAFDPDPDALHCFQTFDDGSGKVSRSTQSWDGTFASALAKLKYLNDECGAGVFAAINRVVPGRRRLAENVLSCRAVFADADDPARALAVVREIGRRGLRPSMIVQTSPGKFHLYWLTRDCPLERFRPMQHAIAAALGTDPSVCDLPRVMRLPGFMHRKGEPFLTRLMGGTFENYSLSDIERAYPPGARPASATRTGQRGAAGQRDGDASSPQAARLRVVLDHHGGLFTPGVRAALAETRKGERHGMLRAVIARLVMARWPDADVRKLVIPAVAAWSDVDPAEQTDKVNSILAWMRRQEAAKLAAQPPLSPAEVKLAAAFRRAGGAR